MRYIKRCGRGNGYTLKRDNMPSPSQWIKKTGTRPVFSDFEERLKCETTTVGQSKNHFPEPWQVSQYTVFAPEQVKQVSSPFISYGSFPEPLHPG